MWQRLSSLTFSTHVGLISPQNCNSNPGRAAVRSRASSLWPLLHNTWNPIKAMKSNQRRLHLVMLISHLLAIKSNSSPKLFIYLFPSHACSVGALRLSTPHHPSSTPTPEDVVVESHLVKLWVFFFLLAKFQLHTVTGLFFWSLNGSMAALCESQSAPTRLQYVLYICSI